MKTVKTVNHTEAAVLKVLALDRLKPGIETQLLDEIGQGGYPRHVARHLLLGLLYIVKHRLENRVQNTKDVNEAIVQVTADMVMDGLGLEAPAVAQNRN
mgnify:CR=1 FL=1